MAGHTQQGNLTEYKKSLIKRDLEMGIVMTVYRQRMERLTVQVITETRQVAWTRTADKTEGVLDLFEIREVRPGKNSKDFDRFKDRNTDANTCFTIFYGSQFVLNTLSLGADSVEDAEKWLTGLELLRQETLAAHTPEIIESWLRKQMYSVGQTKKNSISLKELKSLLPQMNIKIQSGRFLKDRVAAVGAKKEVLDFEQFHKFYNLLTFENQRIILDEFKNESCSFIMGNNNQPVQLSDFQRFLLYQQRETWANNVNQVRELMTIFIDDTMRKTNDPAFTVEEFLGFLFSKENSIWDEKFSEICPQEMNKPLSHYWINSSHNTYLTGDQIRSESSTEAYVRCLRLGCRCIELDCWSGQKEPLIYHGGTMTSKIKFRDAVKAVNDHAFKTSEYPVILSIEEHCDITQQKIMAEILRDVFKDKLLTEPLEPDADKLPSPNQLKGKIIIKHRKIQESEHTSKLEKKKNSVKTSFRKIVNTYRKMTGKAKGSSTMEKEGELDIWDPIDKRFYKHDCVISDNKLYYSEEKKQDSPENIQDIYKHLESHLSEPWFHGRLVGGRQTAGRLLRDFCEWSNRKDGTFLVRESDTFIRNFSISIWKMGRIRHCRIFFSPENGHTFFLFGSELYFPSMCVLIQYYRQNRIEVDGLNLHLTGFLPRSNFVPPPHIGWFYSNLSRGEAEDYLLRIPRDGAFLIRQRKEPGNFALSIRVEGDINHYLINRDGIKYLLEEAHEFFSLEEMVSYYREEPFNGKIKLRYPVTPELVKCCMEDLLTYETEQSREVAEDNPLGDQCKGVVDIWKCNVACKAKHARPLVVTLLNKESLTLLEFTSEILEQLDEWYQVILSIIQREQNLEKERIESKTKISVEMSDLVVYCQSIKDNTFEKYSYKEVRSISDNMIPKDDNILEYNQKALTRVYPSGSRIDSSNFDPCPSWKLGCQMVALNFQTADMFIQLNSALFSLNGGTGYVLKPEWMRDPTKKKTSKQNIRIRVIAARHLPNLEHIVSPFVQVELWPYTNSIGQAEDYSFKTTVCKFNGMHPVWLGPNNPPKYFEVFEPDLSFLRFVVSEEDVFSDAMLIAQATVPFRAIRSGYRSVPLKNKFSENLELASLLVHIDLQS